MIKKVYVPLDGSEIAAAAIQPGALLASRAGAPLVLLAARWPGESESTMRSYLDAHVAFLDGPVDAWVISDKEPVDAISGVSAEPGAIVCMATRGRGSFRAALLGSVAEGVVRSATGTLALVGPSFDPTWKLADHPSILVGTDGRDASRAAAFAACEVAEALDASVELVHVFEPMDQGRTGVPTRTERGISRLATLAEELEARGVEVTARPLDGFDPASLLQRRARERDSSLLALGSHGRSGVSRVALGSVAFKVVRHAPLPVLLAGPNWTESR
jgi:nucleotide-binding universal stress UspA family protein